MILDVFIAVKMRIMDQGTLQTEAAGSSKTMVISCRTTRHHNQMAAYCVSDRLGDLNIDGNII
jgi:hypothetical protein